MREELLELAPRRRGPGIPSLLVDTRPLLEERARVYQETRDPRAAAARRELEEFLAHEPLPFASGLPIPPGK